MIEFLIFGDIVVAITMAMIVCCIVGSRKERASSADTEHRVVQFDKARLSARRAVRATVPVAPRIYPAE